MSILSEYHADLETIRSIVGEKEPGTPEQMMEERVARLVEETIDLAMLALDPEQRPLVQAQWRGVAQMLLRCKLILSVLEGEDVEAIRRLIVNLDHVKPAPTVVSFRR